MKIRLGKKKSPKNNEEGDFFYIDGGDDDDDMGTIILPSQVSAQDTSNWEDRPTTAPDGKLHIKDLGLGDKVSKKRWFGN